MPFITKIFLAPPTKPRAALKFLNNRRVWLSGYYLAPQTKGLLHERPYRLAALATSPARTGEAKIPEF